MKTDLKHLPILLLAGLALALGAPGDQVAFHPSAGSSLTKTFTMESELELQKLTMNMNGNEVDTKAAGGMEMTTSATQTVAVTDTYVALEDGRPSKLRRSFDTLSSKTEVAMSSAMGEQNTTLDGESDLEGLAVEFTWDDDQGDYAVAFAEGSKGEQELLEGLREDTDLRGFLPADEVKPGDTWSVEPNMLRDVLAPGGTVKIEPTNQEGMTGMENSQPSMDQMLGDFEGTVQATFAGTRDEGGTKVAVIKLAVDVSTARDVTKTMQETMKNAEVPGGGSLEIQSVDIEYEFKGEGELHWNVAMGVVHSLSLSGQSGMTIDTALEFDAQGKSGNMETSMVLSGNQSVTVASE